MKRIRCGLVAVMIGAVAVLSSGMGTAGADSEAIPVDYTCDIPPATGVLAGTVPDTAPMNGMVATITDTPDPVVQGAQVHYDLDAPFPDLTGGLPDVGFPIGIIYVKSIDITQPIPAGLDLASVTASLSPTPSWASVSKVGSNLVIHIQSAYPTLNATNGRIRINADAVPTTVEVQETNGTWVPINFIPSVDIDATVSGAPGSTIQWRPSTMNSKLYYQKVIPFLLNINWNDANTPCTPNTPSQVIASTLVGTPGLSVSKTADETSVVAGAGVHFHVTATNTGNVPLTGVVVTDAAAPGCAGSPGALAVGAHVTLDCVVTTSAGNVPTLSNTAGADSNETAAVVSNTVNVSVTPAGPSGVSGTVTESGSGSPVGGAFVAVLRSSDFSIAGGGVANGSGDFSAPVPAGSYFLYVIDPAGGHTAALFGAPTQVTVTAGTMVDADPALAPSRGSVTATVTETGTGTPISGVWGLALSASPANTGATEAAVTANGAGQLTIPGLRAGNHYVGFIDPTGAHATRFFPNSPTLPGATQTAVTAGNATAANASLPTQTPVGTGSTISGTVTEAGTNAPLANGRVLALRAADYQIVRAAATNASGQYTLDLAAGDYKLAFLDATGSHDMEWFDNLPSTGLGSAVSVTAPGTANAALNPNTGTMAGTIVDDPAATPLAGAWAIAIGPTGIAGGAVTAANGTYTLPGLATGTYRATFVDPNGGRTQEYWDNSPTYAGATTFNITAATTTTINAALHHP